MKNKYITIEVTGRGVFPMDMLRHDCAYPDRGEDAYRILDQDRRSVRLVCQACHFTPARWSSFGWPAKQVDV